MFPAGWTHPAYGFTYRSGQVHTKTWIMEAMLTAQGGLSYYLVGNCFAM